MDSSVITTLAARTLGAQGAGPVRSFAVDFAGQAENFMPDMVFGTPDRPYDLARPTGEFPVHCQLFLGIVLMIALVIPSRAARFSRT